MSNKERIVLEEVHTSEEWCNECDCACTNNQTRTKRNKQMNKKHGLLKNCNILLFANKLTWMTKHYRKYNESMKIKMDAAHSSNCRTMRMCEVLCTLRMCRAFCVHCSANMSNFYLFVFELRREIGVMVCGKKFIFGFKAK
uniref:Uncharacterized protein n=1 Tax=Strigamia maritima TaxID=126957 RepID=T1JIX1_STRMM